MCGKKEANIKMKRQNSTRAIFIASSLCSLFTCVLCSLIWMALSGVNWFGFIVLDLAFLVNGCLCGIVASGFHAMFNRLPIPLVLYLGNIIPLGIFFIISFCISPSDLRAWYLLFLVGWMIMSIIPVAVASSIVNKKLGGR